MAECLVALGSNLGDRRATLSRAVALLASPQLRVVAQSGWRETPAVGGPPDQPPFLNGAVTLSTSLAPQALLDELQRIERELGRVRDVHWGPRTVDLDLLLYDELALSDPRLTLPHPRMAFRRFVIEPAAEIAPDMRHPLIGWTLRQLRDHLRDAVPYVAITGTAPGADTTQLALELVERCRGELVRQPSDDTFKRVQAAMRAVESPSLELEWRIEWLGRLCRWLQMRVTPDRKRLAISDFWLEEPLAVVAATLDLARARQFQAFWNEAAADVVRPKLLIVLDPPYAGRFTTTGVISSALQGALDPLLHAVESGRIPSLRQALLNRALRPGVGPVLHLTSNDVEANFAEAEAAIRSME
ncbi:MAG: 2-amino-4-hydroxy-6-hydroxymethyldihydropteridine diphosphokinase [Planctomycetia bacterium]|nr:2-amino-4-hydroxy-6-hydroxymethyldihydropteridine diphosphokinase [Planctomycetia bacterium]